jgi:putative N6-adenine-specific DNA methylase
VEAAMQAFRIAPGLKRRFAAENWSGVPKDVWGREREAALAEVAKDAEFRAFGADIDPASANLAAQNAAKAGVGKRVTAKTLDIADFSPETETGVILCNPPYGERLLDVRAAEGLYRRMGEVFAKYKGLRCYIISPHEDFEKLFGRPADKRRKLYNGMLKCQLFMYFK